MILVCGASGLLGKELCKYLDNNNIEYVGTFNKNKINKDNMFFIDFSLPELLERFLLEKKIKTCVFCIVERLLDTCENNWNEIKHTNIDLVNITSYICNKLNIKFIHLSSDYVFDGSIQPNFPNSKTNPLQNYGISKLISEYRVIKNCKNYCIIRTPVLYSLLSKIHENAVCLIGKNVMDLRSDKLLKEDNYNIRRPLYIYDLCYFISGCIKNNYIGTYHFYNPYNKLTKYEISQLIVNILDIKNNIMPNNLFNETIVSRPYDTQLLDDKYDIFQYKFCDFKDTLYKYFSKFTYPKFIKENKNNLFFMLDLDGTIINSNLAHYNAYKNAFDKHKLTFLSYDEWNNYILNSNIDEYFKTFFCQDIHTINKIKQDKIEFLKNEDISFTKNSDVFLKHLIQNDLNFCIVTNTNKPTINIFIDKLPLLQQIKKWVYRENYNFPKPNKECYDLAKNNFFKDEQYIIGIEDSMVGFNSIKQITDCVFIYNNDTIFKSHDCFIFNDFIQILSTK